jgi:hypothetical protein
VGVLPDQLSNTFCVVSKIIQIDLNPGRSGDAQYMLLEVKYASGSASAFLRQINVERLMIRLSNLTRSV